jgi:hypothetical protein
MRDLMHNGERCGVEGDFAIDEHGDLVSSTEDLTLMGLTAPGHIIHVGTFARVRKVTATRVSLDYLGAWPNAGPVQRVYYGAFWRNTAAPNTTYPMV